MTTILDRIVADKRREIAARKTVQSMDELSRLASEAPAPRDFAEALAVDSGISLIAEVKKASPSRGIIREAFDPVSIAKIYAAHGAACLSVLTDEKYFQGQLGHLRAIREAVELPVLRKDFILDPYQLLEARAAGADAILLIAECLDDETLSRLHRETLQLGMTALVELYEPQNVDRVVDAGAKVIGVNNRDLRSFEVDLDHTIRMRERIPPSCLLVGESGIHGRADALRLQAAGVDAMLVGEHLMASPDMGVAVDFLLGR